MKKNLTLAGILLFLLVLTYFVQEKRSESNYVESLTKDHLITTEIKSLKLPFVQAEKRNGSWWMGKTLLSHNTFKIIEKKISEVKKIKDVTGEPKTFFSNPLVIEVNGEKWTFGDVAFDKQGFYVSKGDKMMIAVIDGESLELTQDGDAIEARKYEDFKAQISKPYGELVEKQLFRFYPDIPLKRVLVEAYERLPYELNFETNKSLPEPLPGIRMHDKIESKFHSLLTQMTIKEELPYSENLKHKRMGTLKFLNEKEVVWELWLRDEKTADAVLIDSQLKRAWLMVGGTVKIYFTMVQDYWDKKIIPPAEFKSFDRLPMLLSQGNKTAEIDVINREPLQFETKKGKLDQQIVLGMVEIIFNLGRFDQADRVSLLSKSERKMLMNQDDLHVMVMGQELVLWVKTEELIVVNLTQGFKAHFGLFHEKTGMRLEDMVK